MNKKYLSWTDIERQVDCIIDQIDLSKYGSLYGLPRGGLIPAVILSHKTGLPLLDHIKQNTLIVDDIYDTGYTLSRFLPFNDCCVLNSKQTVERLIVADMISEDTWIQYPWETEQSSKVDYIKNG